MIPFSPPNRSKDYRWGCGCVEIRLDHYRTANKAIWKNLAAYVDCPAVLCLNSFTSGLELMLRWFGVKEGDEVILPAYTYSATANVVVHCGAKPVFVDVKEDFNIDPDKIRSAISPNTKNHHACWFRCWPCDYEKINALVKEPAIQKQFRSINRESKRYSTVLLVLSDAAHSVGANVHGKNRALTDISVFHFMQWKIWLPRKVELLHWIYLRHLIMLRSTVNFV